MKPRTKDHKDPAIAKAIGWTTLILMVLFSAQTAYQLYLTPSNPGWWAVAWAFGGLAFISGGHLFNLLPRTSSANGLMLSIYIVGFLAVPFAAHFLVSWNVAVGIIAVPLTVALAFGVRYYARMVDAHRTG